MTTPDSDIEKFFGVLKNHIQGEVHNSGVEVLERVIKISEIELDELKSFQPTGNPNDLDRIARAELSKARIVAELHQLEEKINSARALLENLKEKCGGIERAFNLSTITLPKGKVSLALKGAEASKRSAKTSRNANSTT